MNKVEMLKETILTVVKGVDKQLNAEEIRELINVPEDDNEAFREALFQLVMEHKLYTIA